MTYGDPKKQESLHYRILSADASAICEWGHEYVRHLAMEISARHTALHEQIDSSGDFLKTLTSVVVQFFLQHNAEADASDLLYELDGLDFLLDYSHAFDYERICNYLLGCAPFETSPDDSKLLHFVCRLYIKHSEYVRALNVAIKLNSEPLQSELFRLCADSTTRKQMALILSRTKPFFTTASEELDAIIGNASLSGFIRMVAKELQIEEAKTPEDVFKNHLQDPLKAVPRADTHKQSLASSFVNAFVNASFSRDKLLGCSTDSFGEQSKAWIFKHKDSGIVSAVASIGLVCLWDPETAVGLLHEYLSSDNVNVQAGAALGIGMAHCNVRSVSDTAWALLREFLETADSASHPTLKASSIIGADIADTITPFLDSVDMAVSSWASLALGHIFAATGNGETASAILHFLMELGQDQLDSQFCKIVCIGLASIFLGQQEASLTIIETLGAVTHPIGKYAATLVEIYSYAGTGSVLQVQKLLHECTSSTKKDPLLDKSYLSAATIGIAMISMTEEIGKEMAMRTFSHMMHYGDSVIKKSVPLAIGLLYASHPATHVVDVLGKYSHDHDKNVALNSIFAMGIVGAGTNNAKIAQMLRQLAAYYQKDSEVSYSIKLAQGLLALGRGIFSLNPATASGLSFSSLCGLLIVVFALSDCPSIIADRSTFLLYYLSTAIRTKFLIALDESLQPVSAVDVVGQAGRPKTITGFQTHATPVLLSFNEKAEMATEEYVPVSPFLEGFVIVRKNPAWSEE